MYAKSTGSVISDNNLGRLGNLQCNLLLIKSTCGNADHDIIIISKLDIYACNCMTIVFSISPQ